MSDKRINPRRIPRSQADVDKAYEKGRDDAIQIFLNVCLYTLGPDMGMDDDGLELFNKRFLKNLECHIHGELTDKDMTSAMLEEKGWEVEIK